MLHLADDDFLVLATRGIETIFVEEHFAELGPLVPGLLRDVVINLAAEIGVKGRLVEAGKFLVQLDAENLVLHIVAPEEKLSHSEEGGTARLIEIDGLEKIRPAEAGLFSRA